MEDNQKASDISNRVNVLFSDILSTLIKPGERFARDKNLSILLNTYLENSNNYLSLVTSSSHSGVIMIYEMLKDLLSIINEKYHSRVFSFASKVSRDGKKDFEDFLIEKGCTDIKINPIGNKKESVEITLNKLLEGYTLNEMFAVGDSVEDLEMLLSVYDLGGKCAMIGNLSYLDKPLDKLLYDRVHYQLFEEYHAIHSEYSREHGTCNGIEYDEMFIELNRRANDKCIELKELIQNGSFGVDRLKRECFFIDRINSYRFLSGKVPSRSYKDVFEKLNNFSLCSNFDGFYEEHLKIR